MYIGLHVKYPLFLSDFNETSHISKDFRKSLKYQISRKSVQYEPSWCMRTDGRIRRKRVVALRHFTNAPKNGYEAA
jgi:hypothetical protein